MIKNRKLPNNSLELKLLSQGYNQIVGIDEVGRGSFAGPVYVCGYIYKPNTTIVEGVKDSKKLSTKKRTELFATLESDEFVLESLPAKEIDKIGIGKSVENLITKIVNAFDDKTFFLIDGHFSTVFSKNSIQIPRGDDLHYSISCASIIAKVSRDRYMYELAKIYPQYFFEKNVGYGTAVHSQAISEHGITPEHRKSFKPIQQFV